MFAHINLPMVGSDLHYKLDLNFELIMSKLFIEIGFSDKDRLVKYSKEFLFVSKLYSRFISDVKIENLRKIAIQLVNSHDLDHVIPANKLTKVCLIHRYFEWKNLEDEVLEINRYRVILDLIIDVLLEISEKFNWPKEAFMNAYLEATKSGFKNEYVLLPPKFSNDGRYSASLVVVRDKEYSSIFIQLIVKKHESEIKIIELKKISFYEDDLSNIAKSLKWINNEEFVISNKEEEINFKYSVQNNVVEIFLTPGTHDEKYLQDELKLLNPETSKEEYLEINHKRIANLSSLKTD